MCANCVRSASTIGGALTLVFALCGYTQARAQDGRPITVDAIVKSWTARETHARTFDFWGAGRKSTAGRTVEPQECGPTIDQKDAVPFSVPNSTFVVKLRLVADETRRVRFELRDKILSLRAKGYIDQDEIEIYDGDVRQIFFPVGNVEFPNAHITKVSPTDRPRHAQTLPLVLAYRALDPHMGRFDAGGLTLTNDKDTVDKQPCLVLKYGESTVAVDPARDFVPTRYREIRHGVIVRSVEIKYTFDREHGWVPSYWSNARHAKNGEIFETVAITISKYKLGGPIGDEEFQLRLPTGTWVSDYRSNERYILRAGGARRMIAPGEYNGHNYKELLEHD
jgi:hypothetical protein